ncbi:PhzF family phenazine biosynthesis protein [Sphingomonas cavernae]|uniref:PhzF family phenazine biosynthesis protein n=1 Tax=Sphingomonas cavernae TaxID=2320861 RepID=A0A418WPZ4_9SPHN|nr:PhzF family phenazine biosynthesis protein [Sphingomonas cavernae]RJF93303.1 PhzF family phenazine biosynthesis protein [Sphingomonas cavernae]
MKLPFAQIDAFADRPFQGNSAAVIPLDAWLPDELLIRIAMENNLSETAFLVPASDDADYELRWCTPTTEVPLCGHATLAAGHFVLSRDQSMARVRFLTRKAGMLEVQRAGTGYALDLPATDMEPGSDDTLLDILGLPDASIFVACNGVEHIHIVLLPDEAAVRAVRPDFRRLAEVDTMAIVTAPGDSADIASRVFVSAWGIDEDPVTGSAHAALVPFWAERLGRDTFSAFQASARGGHMRCRLEGDRVILDAPCVTVIEGVFSL